MLNLILELYWVDILVATVFIVVLIFLWRRGKKDVVKRIILELVCKSEQTYGSGTGAVKLAMVWSGIYNRLPLLVRLVFTQQELQNIIEYWVDWLRKKLAVSPTYLNGYKDEVK